MTVIVQPGTDSNGNPQPMAYDQDTGKVIVDSNGFIVSGGQKLVNIPSKANYVSTAKTQTVGWQEAINYVFTQGGGKIFVRKGIYTMQGYPTISPSGINSFYSYIWFPYVAVGQKYIPIEIEGETAVGYYQEGTLGSYPPPQNGVIVYQTNNNNSTFQSVISADGNASSDFSQIIPILKNITVRTQPGQSWEAYDFYSSANFYGYHLIADKDEPTTNPTEPVQSGNITDVGIVLPNNSNYAGVGLYSPYVFGYYTGIQIGTHSYVEDFFIQSCYQGIGKTPGGYHAMYLNGLVQWCPYVIYGNGGTNPIYGILDIEDAVGGSYGASWQSPIAHFYNITGKFFVHQVKSGTGIVHDIIVQYTTSLEYEFTDGYQPTPTLSANPPVSATVYQNTNPYDIEIDLPVYATTSGTAGYVTVAKGASSSSLTTIGNQFVNGSTSSTSVDIIRLRVPAGWYYEFTASGVTFGTASVFAD